MSATSSGRSGEGVMRPQGCLWPHCRGVVLRPAGGVCGPEVWSVVSRVDLGLATEGAVLWPQRHVCGPRGKEA